MSKFLSIVIPVFNARPALEEMLASLKHENFDELLLVDDLSSDGSLELCREFAAADPRVRVIATGTHSGCAAAPRNLGLREAAGRYVLFCDADDLVAPGALAGLRETLRSNPAIDVLFGRFEAGYLRGGRFKADWLNRVIDQSDGTLSGKAVMELLCDRGQQLVCNSFIGVFRRDFLLEKQIFQDESLSLGEDHQWLPRVLFAAGKVAAVDTVHYFYIRRDNSISTGLTAKSLMSVGRASTMSRDFYLLHRSEMSPKLRRFWSNHVLNMFLWFFLHPRYQGKIPRREWLAAWRNSDMFGSWRGACRSFWLFAAASAFKKLLFPALLPVRFGLDMPARKLFAAVQKQ